MANNKDTLSILCPKLPKDLQILKFKQNSIEDEFALAYGIVCDLTLENQTAKYVNFDQIIFKNVVFRQASFKNIELTDVRFENCDLSNANFSEAVIHRTEFINCKIMGLSLSETTLRNVLLDKCIGKYTNFRYSDCKQVIFKDSEIEYGDFQNAIFSKVDFQSCNLVQAQMSGVKLEGIDLSSCDIEGMGARIEDLFGLILTPIQVVSLSKIMGIVIKS